MKQIALIGLASMIMLGSISCNAQGNKKESVQNTHSPKVTVYYFHFTKRCATCLAVEENAKKAVETLYADKIKTDEYSFQGINLDDAASKILADKLGVGGQTLLVVRGDKKIDITSTGFLNAHNPEKMKAEIKNAVDKVLF